MAILGKDGQKAVEAKLMDESIAEVMKRGDSKGRPITDPNKVKSEDVEKVYKQKIDSITGSKPTEETSHVVISMTEGKEEQPQQVIDKTSMVKPMILRKEEPQQSKADRIQAITARKAMKMLQM